jgi:hypothetical protein
VWHWTLLALLCILCAAATAAATAAEPYVHSRSRPYVHVLYLFNARGAIVGGEMPPLRMAPGLAAFQLGFLLVVAAEQLQHPAAF